MYIFYYRALINGVSSTITLGIESIIDKIQNAAICIVCLKLLYLFVLLLLFIFLSFRLTVYLFLY